MPALVQVEFASLTPYKAWPQVWDERRQRWSSASSHSLDAEGHVEFTLIWHAHIAGTQTWRIAARLDDETLIHSDEFTVERHEARYHRTVAVGATHTFRGRFRTDTPIPVWGEVWDKQLGRWSRTPASKSSSSGAFGIDLVWHRNYVGPQLWRVGTRHSDGRIEYYRALTLVRVKTSISGPSYPALGAPADLTGRFTTTKPVHVWLEAWSSELGRWSRGSSATSSSSGRYRLRLSWANRAGIQSWRVGARYADGSVVYTSTKRVIRGGANAVITKTTASELSGYHNSSCPLSSSRLKTVHVNYYNYNGGVQRGVVVVRDYLASDVAKAFTAAYNAKFPIYSMRTPTRWRGSDPAMMADNNTSAYNCRKVTGNPYAWSPHAYGIAVDVNPRQNPYRDPRGRWWPTSTYAYNRPNVTGLMHSSDAIVGSFRSQGWDWYSGWDWHHFQKRR